MKAYTIFDDFGSDAIEILENAGIELTVLETGNERPDCEQMKRILEEYDCVIIGTSQKITQDMFENITENRIIATASVGVDHIQIPEEKKHLVQIINTPKANAQSVAEYTIGCALTCCKRIFEGNELYKNRKNNKALSSKPEDLFGKTMGVVGAGNISLRIMEYAFFMGMHVLCWTAHPEKHRELEEKGVEFVSLENLVKKADVISVNLPNNKETQNFISQKTVSIMKENAIFISVSRLATVDVQALFLKAQNNPNFYVCLDIDVDENVSKIIPKISNVFVTPHIAGGTLETRKRMFLEVSKGVAKLLN